MDIFSLALYLFVVNCVPSSATYFEKNLMRHLLDNYGDRAVRPVNDTSDSIDVQARLLIAQVIKFDEPLQQLIINGWLKMVWKDVYLQWEPEQWGNITHLSVFTNAIWKPDITFYENVDEKWESIKDIEASLTSDGTVTWLTPTILQVSCKVKVRYFPLDYQRCNITMASWRYDKSELDMIALYDVDANQNVYDENGIWTLYRADLLRAERKFACCENPYALLVLQITMKRNPGFYIYNIIAPCLLLSIMTVFVFRVPPESGEKISLGMTNVLALILYQQLISSNMPPLGDEMPVIGVYFLSMIVMGCISVMTTVVILRVYHYPATKPIPTWINYIICQRSKGNKSKADSSVNTSTICDQLSTNVVSLMAPVTQPDIHDSTGKKITPGDEVVSAQIMDSEWRRVAFLLDKLVFVLLTLAMVVVFLYVVVEYLLYLVTLEEMYETSS
ncbi:neuronal acetylcholine receptor subunit alpha-3-like [Amphiura filiformis]|uniref:neuronal acetylcholine receptor subunit alpha-3-like n=1 Tax=Amphiura filiformis TaxID=82378 RepID=UPI003B227635